VIRRAASLALCAALAACSAAPRLGGVNRATGPLGPPRNVLFVIVDDLRPELGCYGGLARTPHLDELASRSLVFDRAYCQMATCGASRASVLTGMRPGSTGVLGNAPHFRAKAPDVITLPQLFHQHGFQAEAIGKVYHNSAEMQDPPSWSAPARTWDNWVWADDPERGYRDRGAPWEAADVDDDAYPDGEIAAAATERLRELAVTGEPFFLAVGFLRPHLPFNAPKRYFDLYDPASIPAPDPASRAEGAPPWQLTSWGELRSYAGVPAAGPLDADATRALRHAYLAATSYADAQVGRVLAALEDSGLSGDTVVVLWSDHGWKLGEFGAWSKHTNVELDTRVPMMLCVPGVTERGPRTAAPSELVDLYPTLVELFGLPAPPTLEGESLAPLLVDPDAPALASAAAFSQYPRTARVDGEAVRLMGESVRTARWRLTRWRPRGDASAEPIRIELYDHAADPDERRNVADSPALAGVVDELLERLSGRFDRPVPAR